MNSKPYRKECGIDGCTSEEFKKLNMKDKSLNVQECKKCRNVIDFSCRAEDEKHRVYHETGKEPKDKSGITEEKRS